MKTKRKRDVPGRAREVLAGHLRRYMEAKYKMKWETRGAPTHLIREFSRDSGVPETTIQRAASPQTYQSGSNIDTVEKLARAMGVKTYELLKAPGDDESTN